MAEANIVITDVKITPNPVTAADALIISVGVAEKIYGILEKGGSYILTKDGAFVGRVPGSG